MGRVARYEGVENEHDEKRGTHRKGSKVGREKWLDRNYGRKYDSCHPSPSRW
jgi:hypothetical protein